MSCFFCFFVVEKKEQKERKKKKAIKKRVLFLRKIQESFAENNIRFYVYFSIKNRIIIYSNFDVENNRREQGALALVKKNLISTLRKKSPSQINKVSSKFFFLAC